MKGSLQSKLLRSFLTLAFMGLILWVVTFIAILWLRNTSDHFVSQRAPAVKSALIAKAGIHRSLAGLRGWVALGDEKFKDERRVAWISEIHPSIASLKLQGIHSLSADEVVKFDRLLTDLNESQWWVEDVAWSAGNEPAQVIFSQKVEPISKVIVASLNEMIEQNFSAGEDSANKSLRKLVPILTAHLSGEDLLGQFLVNGESWLETAFLQQRTIVKEAFENLQIDSDHFDGELRSQLKVLKQELPWYETFSMEAIEARKRSDWNTAQNWMKTETVPCSEEVIAILNKLTTQQITLMHDEAASVHVVSKRVIYTSLGLMILIAFSSGLMSYFRAKQITLPLAALKKATANLAAGQLDDDLPITTNDELGSLTMAFNQMRGSLRVAEADLLKSYDSLSIEHDRAENLLLNILPKSIAERLKNDDGLIADNFPEATILFADIVGFTELSSKISPQELVKMLNAVFSRFDNLAERHGLEKIKTIGDAYMVVGGLPIPDSDHPGAVANMALEMVEEIAAQSELCSMPLSIRIGIHCGPVVAGVIGLKKFIYDIWGDTVNLASRMESHGIEGKIQVSEEFYNRTKSGFIFEDRGEILIKGKGELRTYFLISRSKE